MIRLNTNNSSPFLSDSEIRQAINGPASIADKLASLVTMFGNRLQVDVCSIYLFNSERNRLILAATVGLNKNCVGKLSMALDEGLAGLVAEQLSPIAVEDAAKHPRFKYFPDAEEDRYESFLGVPILDKGVLVVQTVEPCRYAKEDTLELVETANRLGRHLSKFRLDYTL